MLHFQKWKLILVCVVVVGGFLFALPNLFPAATMARLPSWLPHQQVNLGLDLQGGSHLLLEVDVGALVQERLDTLVDVIGKALQRRGIGYGGLTTEAGAIT